MHKVLSSSLLSMLVALAALLPASFANAATGRCGNCGTIVDVDQISYAQDKGRQGAVAGAIIGGLLGNQVGGGSGRTAATVAGVVAGGLIGSKVDKNNSPSGERGLRLEVRMDRGGYRTVEIHGNMRLYRGDRVRVYNDRVTLL